jgi:hypothetical protein
MAVQENELSLLKGAPGAIDEKAEDGTRSYSIGGVQLATWSEAGARGAADDAAQFARFMRYAQGGHPQLLDKLAKGGVIPQHLSFVLSGDRTLQLDISAVRTIEPQAYDLKTFKREMSGSGLDAMFDRIAAMTPAQLTAYRAQYLLTAERFQRSRTLLDTNAGQAGMRAQAPRKAYVLKVFEANHRARLKQPKEASVCSWKCCKRIQCWPEPTRIWATCC